MRFHEIITPIIEATTTKPEEWETRFARHQRQQAKQAKARSRIASAEDAAARHRRTAADRLAADHDKLATAKRALATAQKPPTV